MTPATKPRAPGQMRVLVVERRASRVVDASALAEALSPGDLVVVNDAATLPASFAARTSAGETFEVRLTGVVDDGRRWSAALLGRGDFRTRTEDRPPPPALSAGARVVLGSRGLEAEILRVIHPSGRLVELSLGDARPLASLWRELYLAGRPVQYAYVPEALALWDVQNVFAGRPWAVEMPSAGRALRAETLLALRRRGVDVARVTHAAGLSSIGDAAIDRVLPLPERFEVPEETVTAIGRARARGGRVVAIGTSVVRALEGAYRSGVRRGTTDLLLDRGSERRVVDAVLTGVHETETTHFALLRAFADDEVLSGALERAKAEGLLGHEFGDGCLVFGDQRPRPIAPCAAI